MPYYHLRRLPSRGKPHRGRPSTTLHSATYVTTKEFLLEFGLDTLRDLPDFEALEDAGLLGKDKILAGDASLEFIMGEEA